ncbi:MAG: hypothetical protein Q8O42_07075 [Acidobacteriota bacterium]|nr:hypothetical protein [Acidobacteriota bacterium]
MVTSIAELVLGRLIVTCKVAVMGGRGAVTVGAVGVEDPPPPPPPHAAVKTLPNTDTIRHTRFIMASVPKSVFPVRGILTDRGRQVYG